MPSTSDEHCQEILQYILDYLNAEADIAYNMNYISSRLYLDAQPWVDTLDPEILEEIACLLAGMYRKISNISRTKSQNLNVSRLGLQVSSCYILKPSVKWRMKM